MELSKRLTAVAGLCDRGRLCRRYRNRSRIYTDSFDRTELITESDSEWISIRDRWNVREFT